MVISPKSTRTGRDYTSNALENASIKRPTLILRRRSVALGQEMEKDVTENYFDHVYRADVL